METSNQFILHLLCVVLNSVVVVIIIIMFLSSLRIPVVVIFFSSSSVILSFLTSIHYSCWPPPDLSGNLIPSKVIRLIEMRFLLLSCSSSPSIRKQHLVWVHSKEGRKVFAEDFSFLFLFLLLLSVSLEKIRRDASVWLIAWTECNLLCAIIGMEGDWLFNSYLPMDHAIPDTNWWLMTKLATGQATQEWKRRERKPLSFLSFLLSILLSSSFSRSLILGFPTTAGSQRKSPIDPLPPSLTFYFLSPLSLDYRT